jgi:CheY-like chemotaxis protein
MQTESALDRSEQGRKGVILVVDDEEDILRFIADALSELGAEVVTAVNGDIALVILRSGVPVDLLFTDIVMPGTIDGISLAEQAKQLHPTLKILYSTGHAGIKSRGDRPLHGDILRKPYRVAELIERVTALTAMPLARDSGCALQ